MFGELRVGCFLESFRGLNKILNGNENTGVFCICCVGVTINQFAYIKWMEGSGGMKQLNTSFSKKADSERKSAQHLRFLGCSYIQKKVSDGC